MYLSGLTASSRHAAVTAGKDRHPPHADVAQSVRAPRRVDAVGSSPTVCTIGVTSCLAAARSVSLRKWSFLCAVRKRQDDGIYLLAGTGLVKMNGCDRRTGAGLQSSVVGSGAGVCGENPRRNRQIWTRRGSGCLRARPLCRSVAIRTGTPPTVSPQNSQR